MTILRQETYEKARLTRDRHYDGQFYFAVATTGIFCRPSCPSPQAKSENVHYFDTLMAAMDAGYRPCLRCCPDVHTDYYSGHHEGIPTVEDGLQMIYEGYLLEHRVGDLARALYVSERTLRNHFKKHLGMAPITVANYHRGLFARQLLLSTPMTMTDVATASGYASIRQFNEGFKKLFGTTPSALKKDKGKHGTTSLKGMVIPVAEDFDFQVATAFMRPRIMVGVERFTDDSYERTFLYKTTPGHFKVTFDPNLPALRLTVTCDDVRALMPIYHRVRRMFDLGTDFDRIRRHLSKDPLLSKAMAGGPVPRIPVAYDPFEFVVRAILGQVVSVKFATTLAIRVTQRCGLTTPDHFPEGLDHFFPSPEALYGADLNDLGLSRNKIATIKAVIDALKAGTLSLDWHQSLTDFHRDFIQIKGIGDWTVHYVAMRGLGMKDAFPYNDLGVVKALSTKEDKATAKAIKERGKAWAPFRSYATLCLWQL